MNYIQQGRQYMRKLKLTIELLPKGAWENDLSRTLLKNDWNYLRNKCYKRANYRCEICGCETENLNAHEVWDFNIKTKTQTLIDIVALCTKCHGVKHIRNSQRLGFGENAKKHFMKVNNCNELEFASFYTDAQIDFEAKNQIYRWKMVVDLDKFGGKGIKIKENYIPIINSDYSIEEIENLKAECSFTPRILNININNYNGTISVVCDKTNKIEWYDDKSNLIDTRYNFSEKFTTNFSVKNLYYQYITFKLFNEYGKKISKKFYLIKYS